MNELIDLGGGKKYNLDVGLMLSVMSSYLPMLEVTILKSFKILL